MGGPLHRISSAKARADVFFAGAQRRRRGTSLEEVGVNQILCGDTVIDTDDIQLAIKIEGEDAQRSVFLRGGRTAILRGEEEVAFDVWAATLPRAGGDGIDMEQIIDRIIARDRDDPFPTEKEWREWLRECLRGKTDPKPLCKTCACHEAESGHCAEFAGNHYPECYVLREKEPETKPPEKAKVLLLSRVWECNKCGEVLAIDITTGEPADVSRDEVHIDGEVKIRIDGVPLVRCPNCQTVNEWPAELRERITKWLEEGE